MSPDESITRFLVNRKDFSPDKNAIRPRAFLPNPQMQTSVFRTDDLSESDVVELGKQIAKQRGKTFYGRTALAAGVFYDADLDIQPDEPPLHHANVVGWPAEKDEQIAIAQQLAARAPLMRSIGEP